MDTSDWITASIAVLSLIISISVAILDFQRNKRYIKIICDLDYSSYKGSFETEGVRYGNIIIRVVNIGIRPIEIREAGFMTDSFILPCYSENIPIQKDGKKRKCRYSRKN